ncbi:MAG: C1 family peptidase [Marinilabiliaceae bacterium]|nr:C1 family peptidase [Marinilabiliaceae bacterium]
MIQRTKKLVKVAIIAMITLSMFFALQSCEDIKDAVGEIIDELFPNNNGWWQDEEDMDNIPEDITPFEDDEEHPTPPPPDNKLSLEHLFPPIGDQGQYGTCVAWAVGYGHKTALDGIDKGWTQSQLASTSNQISPKDLWFGIPDNKKGASCNGTNFEPAYDALISKGAASLSSVPYSSLGNCNGTATGSSSNKLANYRKIASETTGLDVANFKGYLNAGRPISIGARLGDRFMGWNSASVISSDTYNDPGMQHAYHAMVLVGYDDDKNAFRVRNSWGPRWGDDGSIWVDYDFFCSKGGKEFCFAAFVAQNPTTSSMGSGTPAHDDDLMSLKARDWEFDPEENPGSDDHFTRTFEYEVYNAGNNTVYPSQKWMVAYMYYNAKNAKEYEVIFVDYYTNEFGAGDGYWDTDLAQVGGWWNNETLPSRKSVGPGFIINYVMPEITGDYYLVLMADAFDVIREGNEDNNFYFISAADGKPIKYVNGVPQNMVNPKSLQIKNIEKKPEIFSNTENQTLVKPGNLNTYTPQELKTMLLHDKKTGKLEQKIKSFVNSGGNGNVQKVKK